MEDIWKKVNSKIPEILQTYKKIAVVGLSPKTFRPSHSVARYLVQAGFEIFPVNPGHETILERKSYARLSDIPEPIEIVDIFRRSEDVLPIVEEAIKIGAKVIWMQSGIVNEAAAKLALENGLDVVMDACIKVEHSFMAH